MGGDLQIKNVVDPDLSFAPDEAAADRKIHDNPFTAHFASRERQIQAYRDAEMFTTFDVVSRNNDSETGCDEAATALLAAERRHHEQRGHPLAHRERPRAQDPVMAALRTAKGTGHEFIDKTSS